MAVTQNQLDRLLAQARVRESQGYFVKVKAGDQRAGSYFTRLVAYDVNPSGNKNDVGWLSKPSGTNVDGYAEDALAGNADAFDLHNVIDLINGTGAPGASLPPHISTDDLKQRREDNRWVAPKPLTAEELAYLTSGGIPVPVPPTIPPFPPRDETLKFGLALNEFYRAKGAGENGTLGGRFDQPIATPRHTDIEGEVVWLSEYLRRRQLGESHDDATMHVLADVNAAWPK